MLGIYGIRGVVMEATEAIICVRRGRLVGDGRRWMVSYRRARGRDRGNVHCTVNVLWDTCAYCEQRCEILHRVLIGAGWVLDVCWMGARCTLHTKLRYEIPVAPDSTGLFDGVRLWRCCALGWGYLGLD